MTVVFDTAFDNATSTFDGVEGDLEDKVPSGSAGDSWILLFDTPTLTTINVNATPNTISPASAKADVGMIYHMAYTVTTADTEIKVTYAEVDISLDDTMWIIGRYADADNFFCVRVGDDQADTCQLYKIVSGTATQIGSDAQSPGDGDVVELKMSGNTISVDVNSSEIITGSSGGSLSAAGKSCIGWGEIGSDLIFANQDLTLNQVISAVTVTEVGAASAGPAYEQPIKKYLNNLGR